MADRGLKVEWRVANGDADGFVEHLDPIENRVRELVPAVRGPAAIQQLGLH